MAFRINSGMKRRNFSWDDQTFYRAKLLADRAGVSISGWLRQLVSREYEACFLNKQHAHTDCDQEL